MIDLYYCAAGVRQLHDIAVAAGFRYGAQLPNTVYSPPEFADQDWKKPNRDRYMDALRLHRPSVATVLDWTSAVQLSEVLSWAEEAAATVETVIVIPKVIGGVCRIPERINGKPIRLGYSVRTRFGSTPVPLWEFARRPVHLLGGSPHRQMYLTGFLNVVSADSNYIQSMATKYCQFWTNGDARYAKNRWFPTIREADGERMPDDAPYEAFRRSCQNVMQAWRELESECVALKGD